MNTKHGTLERKAVILKGHIKMLRLQLKRFEQSRFKDYRKKNIKKTKQSIKKLNVELNDIENQIKKGLK